MVGIRRNKTGNDHHVMENPGEFVSMGNHYHYHPILTSPKSHHEWFSCILEKRNEH